MKFYKYNKGIQLKINIHRYRKQSSSYQWRKEGGNAKEQCVLRGTNYYEQSKWVIGYIIEQRKYI